MNDDILKLYNVLQSAGYNDLGTSDEFGANVQDENKRRKLYDALVRDGYNDLGTFEQFSGRLVKPIEDQPQTARVETQADVTPVQKDTIPDDLNFDDEPQGPARVTEPEQPQETPQQQRARLEASMQAYSEQMGPPTAEQQEQYNAMKAEYEANPLVQLDARISQAQKDMADMQARITAIRNEAYSHPTFTPPGAIMNTTEAGLMGNEEYTRLQAAVENKRQEIRQLEHLRDGKSNNFWTNIGDVFANPSTWTFGLAGLYHSLVTMGAAKDSEDESSQVLLGSLLDRNVAEAETEEQRGFWGHAGRIAGEMVPFMVEIGLTGGLGGVAEATEGGVARMAGKYAEKKAVKVLGTLAGDLASGMAMAGTIGAAHTAEGMLSAFRSLPTRWVGEFGSAISGCFASRSCSSCIRKSNS